MKISEIKKGDHLHFVNKDDESDYAFFLCISEPYKLDKATTNAINVKCIFSTYSGDHTIKFFNSDNTGNFFNYNEDYRIKLIKGN